MYKGPDLLQMVNDFSASKDLEVFVKAYSNHKKPLQMNEVEVLWYGFQKTQERIKLEADKHLQSKGNSVSVATDLDMIFADWQFASLIWAFMASNDPVTAFRATSLSMIGGAATWFYEYLLEHHATTCKDCTAHKKETEPVPGKKPHLTLVN